MGDLKRGLGINVFDAAKKRIQWTFENTEVVAVAFSGGKDSTVMLHMVADEARRQGKKVHVFFIDLEGQYDLTDQHVRKCFDMYSDIIIPYWLCLQLHLRNAVSSYETHWIAWEQGRENDWVRSKPSNAISDLPFFKKGMEFEEFVIDFAKYIANGKRIGCFIGIRSDESLNRFRTIASTVKKTIDGLKWTTVLPDQIVNVYPIYDWKTKDIWIYHAKNKDRPYNKLYDRMHLAGLTIAQMRICQPYGDDQRKGLWLFHIIEPQTWARIVARVNGANSGALYVGEIGNVSGYKKISKPSGHTWKSFAYLLLESLPPRTKEHYSNKIYLFVKWWKDKGIEILDEADPIDEAKKKAPSWRRVCKVLLRNDYWCKGLSFSQHKSTAYEKYLKLMKKRRKTTSP